MRLSTLLLLAFLSIPAIEIYLLIEVGGLLGPTTTILLVIATAVLGASLVRLQGFSVLLRVRAAMDRGEVPALEMMEGLLLLISGVLLVTPGFFTDVLGFMLLLPPLRRVLIVFALKHGSVPVRQGDPGQGESAAGRTLEGDYVRHDGKT